MLIQIRWDEKLVKNIGVAVVINGCAYSGCRTLKLAISHEESNGINS